MNNISPTARTWRFSGVNIIKGVVIGAAMLIPGVSGGTIAIICGIYDKLLSAVATFRQNTKYNLLLLVTVALGGIIGIIAFSKPILYVYDNYQLPTMYFFIGAILGSIPILCHSAKITRFSYRVILFPAIGIGCLILFSLLPQGSFVINSASPGDYLYLVLCGFFLAVALILPGISFSYMLLLLGIYEQSLLALQNMELLFLACLVIGVVIGVLVVAKAFKYCLDHFPTATYMVIVGFVLASLKDIFPGIPGGSEFIFCLIAAVVGFCLIFFVSKKINR